MKFRSLFLVLTALLFTLNACKKDEDEQVVIQPNPTISELGANDETARMEYDKSLNEIFDALNNTGIQTGRASSPQSGVILPCGVIKLDSTSIPGVYKFVYDSTCGVRVLSGSISARLSSGPWNQQGAMLELTFTNYRVLYTKNNQTLEFNGPIRIENALGGTLFDVVNPLNPQTSINHKISGSIDITFDFGDTRRWRIRKQRTFEADANSNSGFAFKLDKDSLVAEVGTTRNGDPFTADFTSPLIYRACGPNNLTYIAMEGVLVYRTPTESATAEAGYKLVSGQPVLDGDCGSAGYKLTYTVLGQTLTAFQYY